MPQLAEQQLMIETRHLAMLKALLQQWLPHAEIWAYGSRVTAQAHEASDLDLVVRNPSQLMLPTESLLDAKDSIVESNLPIRVDMVDWAKVPEHFRQEIARAYVVVQSANKSTADTHA